MNSDKGSETIKNSSIIFEDALSDTTSVALTRKRKFNKRCLAKKIMLAGIITALSLAVITLLAMVEKMYSDMRDVKLRLMSLEKEQVTREQVTRELLKQNNYSQAFLLDHLQSIVQNLSRSAVTQEQAELIALRVSGQEENLSNLQAIVGEVNYSAIINEGHLNSLQMAVQDLNHSVVRAKNCYDERHICRLQPRPNKVLYSRHCYTDEVDFLIPNYFNAAIYCAMETNIEYVIHTSQITLFDGTARCECSVVNLVTDNPTNGTVHGPVQPALSATCIMIIKRCPIL